MNSNHHDDAIDLDAVCRSLSHPAVLPRLLEALEGAAAPAPAARMRVRKNLGVGSVRRGDGRSHGDLRRIVVAFDEDTFAEIRARAENEGTSFAEQVRTLVEWGLEAE